MSSKSSTSSEEDENFIKDVEDQKVLEVLTSHSKFKSLDDLVELRWYCMLVLIMAEITAFTALASVMVMVFAGANPTVVGCDNTVVNGCHEYYSLKNRSGCTPVLEYQFESVQVEFNYICDDAKKVKNTITIQTFGVLVGAAIFGQVSDNFGRRKALIISCIGNAIFNLISSYSPSLFYFMLWRTVSGIFAGGLTVVQMVYMVENIPRHHRMWIQNSITWSPNLIIFPYIAYLAQNWRTLSVVISATSVLSFLALMLLEESPRWLVQKGKLEEARRLLIKIRKTDGLYTSDFEKDLDEVLKIEAEKQVISSKKSKKYTFIHLFCTWKMIAQTMTFIVGIICTNFIVYALLYNMEKLSGSLYWNSAIIGAARWVVNIVVSIADYQLPWFGRRLINHISMIFTLASLAIVAGYVYIGNGGYVVAIGTTVALAMCSQLFIAKYLMVNELYPTAVRNLAVSAVSTMSRVGGMFSPQLFYLSDIAEWIPYAVLVGFQLVDLVLFCITIPETKGVHLENHLPPEHKRIFGKRS
ncbi:Major facilitator superfamily (MFS) profile domain-containing protein [Caenorhabditis elegans]|uniref:Major facilitator superfamily (MFS) profile domain-containing protein n=1 Tax=Caenorhabditis elegans TaxID=6239 RepID=G5EDU0_CAEEL|nr:Major facilitator superfamily (MFS) profile domain-containing protein [Caenorhabditis elegans]AAF73198.1 multispecific organic anion transporter [Caenorhabditis elegans]CCD65923.1 Major facilitator superfamily (MFS) profile domain-containing protein [Caenorhabditis elegans]|eukprot:NP_501442.2 Organic Anion Transporter [Caenorhabditis elegans]